MYGELASIGRTIGLSPQEALDSAKTFLTQRGYHVVQRKKHSLAVERHRPGQAAGAAQDAPKLTVLAGFQPGGGVRIRVRGNDPEGVQERQAEWVEWSEALPKEQEARTDEPGDQQRYCRNRGTRTRQGSAFRSSCGERSVSAIPVRETRAVTRLGAR